MNKILEFLKAVFLQIFSMTSNHQEAVLNRMEALVKDDPGTIAPLVRELRLSNRVALIIKLVVIVPLIYAVIVFLPVVRDRIDSMKNLPAQKVAKLVVDSATTPSVKLVKGKYHLFFGDNKSKQIDMLHAFDLCQTVNKVNSDTVNFGIETRGNDNLITYNGKPIGKAELLKPTGDFSMTSTDSDRVYEAKKNGCDTVFGRMRIERDVFTIPKEYRGYKLQEPLDFPDSNLYCVISIDSEDPDDTEQVDTVYGVKFGEKHGSNRMQHSTQFKIRKSSNGDILTKPMYIWDRRFNSFYIINMGIGKRYGRLEKNRIDMIKAHATSFTFNKD